MPDLITVLLAIGVPIAFGVLLYTIPPRWVSRLVRQTPDQLAGAIKQAYPLEEVAQVVTASMVNTALVLSNDKDFAPKMVALSKELTPIAVQSYLQAPPTQSPGQALVEKRWGPTRGNSPARATQEAPWWLQYAEPFMPAIMQRMMGGVMAGGGEAGSVPVPGGPPAGGAAAGASSALGGSPI